MCKDSMVGALWKIESFATSQRSMLEGAFESKCRLREPCVSGAWRFGARVTATDQRGDTSYKMCTQSPKPRRPWCLRHAPRGSLRGNAVVFPQHLEGVDHKIYLAVESSRTFLFLLRRLPAKPRDSCSNGRGNLNNTIIPDSCTLTYSCTNVQYVAEERNSQRFCGAYLRRGEHLLDFVVARNPVEATC